PDIGDLAAQMEMDQLKAVGHASVFEVVKRFDDFGERQTELAAEAGAGAPAARAARIQLDADTQDGLDLYLGGVLTDGFQPGEFFNNRDDFLADLAGQHGHLNELIVLEAVADDRRLHAVGHGQHGKQLGLRAGFQTEAVLLAEIQDFLDDVALLVDLDR